MLLSLIVASAGSVAGGVVFFGAVAAVAATLVRAARRQRRTPAGPRPPSGDGTRLLRRVAFLAGWLSKD